MKKNPQKPSFTCTVASPGVEVVTVRAGGLLKTTVYGGILDGEVFFDGAGQHDAVCKLVQGAEAESLCLV